MSTASPWPLSDHDRDTLRRLAEGVARAAADPIMDERRRLWLRFAANDAERPLVLAEVGGVRDEVLPDTILTCEAKWARNLERGLRTQLWEHETLRDDHVIEPWIQVNWQVKVSNYGVEVVQHRPETEGKLGARRWDPPIRDLATDFDKLRPRTATVDREGTFAWKAHLESLFAGILPVRIRGGFWWTMGMTMTAIDLIGLENLMLFMYDDPDGLHRLMAFLRDDHIALTDWYEREGLLSLNNENDYIGSGSRGYTAELPQPGQAPDAPVRLQDLWGLSESQETVGVGPEQFEEFIFPYQRAVIERFGLCYYGCCEPVHNRWHVIKRFANLRRVSVSPWADEPFMAEACGRTVGYSRKPNPTLISTENFDENAIRADLRRTLEVAKGCNLEIIMKDVHTLNNEPARLPRWVALAREEIAKACHDC